MRQDLLCNWELGFLHSGSNGSMAATSEWLIEGRRLVPLLPRLVPQTVFTQTANQAAKEAAEKNLHLINPALTGNKECEWVYFFLVGKSS